MLGEGAALSPSPSLLINMTEDYTPSINIQPPDSEEQALLDTLGLFDNYCSSSDGATNFSAPNGRCVPALFIQPSDSPSLSELSPLEPGYPEFTDYSHRYSPSTSGRSSPIDAGWSSPASSFSGEVFPEDFSTDELGPHWAPQHGFSAHSSPALSPSLSPLTSAFNEFGIEESYPGLEQSVLPSGLPTFSRLRSSSHSVPSVSPAEGWADGVGRGRSSSFSATTTDNQFYPNDESAPQGSFLQYGYSDNSEVQISVADLNTTYSGSLGTGMSWGMQPVESGAVPAGDNMQAPGHLAMNWTYPSNGEQRATDSSPVDRAPRSPSHLTVPSLRRRDAMHGRSRSASDLTSLVPPDQDVGRGRGQHRSALSIPTSRSVSNGSRSASPYRSFQFRNVQTPASFSTSSPSSPAFEDAEAGSEGVSVGRRRTFTAIRAAEELLPLPPSLARASSTGTPTKGRRSKASASPSTGLGVFKAEKNESSSFLSSPSNDGPGGLQQEFRVSQPTLAVPFKREVASNKIRRASSARRINAAAFKCPIPTCESTFTARHNLMNHINSHNKYRPHACKCGMSFTTQGVLNRHKKRCNRK
ncbi:hypothetical protein DFH07DRAFT_819148 [Mycena maculata]|uniref:C2H2-type domain-containing protein n=1 Tax=Mycena maculata TaxID=230809 RepID=A0AAD7NFJ2_9AGAR|nr:hypothetical protein DFH07DRAFT_819148 [Mycena maculata]